MLLFFCDNFKVTEFFKRETKTPDKKMFVRHHYDVIMLIEKYTPYPIIN